MTTKEVFHLWANQSRTRAKSGSVSFQGETLFSYAAPIGKIVKLENGETIVILNPCRYSVTTSGHQTQAGYASCHLERLRLDPSVLAWHQVRNRADVIQAEKLQSEADCLSAENEKRLKRENAKRNRERKKLDAMDLAEKLARWKNGERIPLPHSLPVSLRLIDDGKRIETSRGAIVPVKLARLAWPIIRAGESVETFTWGNYQGLKVIDGSLVVGCHCIPLPEVSAMAEKLGLS